MGDSIWTLGNTNSQDWKEIPFPSNPPNRMNQENLLILIP